MKRISVIFGTRPEAIKLAPVVLRLKEASGFRVHVCVTGQHREMLDQVLGSFAIVPDADLDVMMPNQGLADLTARTVSALDPYLAEARPDFVLVQGDTTTAFCGALASFYRRIPVGHVEAGLRTGDLEAPWPEEANRVLVSRLAALHFAATEANRQDLLDEGVPPERIVVTGNTVIDALLLTVARVREDDAAVTPALRRELASLDGRRLVLVTAHRRESFGAGIWSICDAVRSLAAAHDETRFVYPVHPNPRVRDVVRGTLGDVRNVRLLAPLDYLSFVALLDRSDVVLTDSGGLQEEAPSLGKPVVVMRDTTERREGLEAGTARLVGTDRDRIYAAVNSLLTDPEQYDRMVRATNPYGDGRAARRILAALEEMV